MKRYLAYILAVFFLFFFLSPLAARESSLYGIDPLWLPAPGEEYMAFNFAGFMTSDVQGTLMDGQPDIPLVYDEERASLDYRSSLFQLFVDGSLLNDGKYSEQEPYLGGRYIYLNNAYIKMNFKNFELKAGRGPHHDVVDTPYSLFISSADIPALHAEINYKGNFFFYKSRWVSMSFDSDHIYYGTDPTEYTNPPSVANGDDITGTLSGPTYWLDKGMNFKVYGLNFGDWQFGFEDVIVYLGRSFDADYFFDPFPQYFLQLFSTEWGTPWVQAGNQKSMIGFFYNLDRKKYGGSAQILIDDLNLDILPWVNNRSFKSKVAWNFSLWEVFDFGKIGFHHAGATKYTFESTRTIESSSDWGTRGYVEVPYSILPYEYAYYPVTQYGLKSGKEMPIHYEDTYAGYKYGENNLAFLVDYEGTLFKGEPQEFKLYSSFEYVMNGSKSPANPWQEYDSPRNPDIESSQWVLFSGAPIEHILRVKANARKRIGKFTLMVESIVGYVFNGIKLVDVPPDYEDYADVTWVEPKIYVPQNGNNYPTFQLTIGANYTWRIR